MSTVSWLAGYTREICSVLVVFTISWGRCTRRNGTSFTFNVTVNFWKGFTLLNQRARHCNQTTSMPSWNPLFLEEIKGYVKHTCRGERPPDPADCPLCLLMKVQTNDKGEKYVLLLRRNRRVRKKMEKNTVVHKQSADGSLCHQTGVAMSRFPLQRQPTTHRLPSSKYATELNLSCKDGQFI